MKFEELLKQIKEENVMKILYVCITLVILTTACSSVNEYFGWNDDHPAEEFFEAVIEAETGLDIDLSPMSPE